MVTTQRLEEMFGKFKEEIIESIKCDDNEQYSRRYCLRMHGLKYDKNENQNDIVSKVLECFSEIGLSYEEAEIDMVHRIGKPYNDNEI